MSIIIPFGTHGPRNSAAVLLKNHYHNICAFIICFPLLSAIPFDARIEHSPHVLRVRCEMHFYFDECFFWCARSLSLSADAISTHLKSDRMRNYLPHWQLWRALMWNLMEFNVCQLSHSFASIAMRCIFAFHSFVFAFHSNHFHGECMLFTFTTCVCVCSLLHAFSRNIVTFAMPGEHIM